MTDNDQRTQSGGCLCGRARYVLSGTPHHARCCHCSRCRKAFSAACSSYAEVSPESFSWLCSEDELTLYQASPELALAFCKTCGSTLCGLFKGRVHGVTLGTLDGEPQLHIEWHQFVASKAGWHAIGDAAPQFPQQGHA